jgi:hypothetical protein
MSNPLQYPTITPRTYVYLYAILSVAHISRKGSVISIDNRSLGLRDHSLFMTGGGLARKGGGSWGIFDWKGGAPKNISSEGGVQLFFIVEKNLTCNDYCYHRSFFFILIHANHPFSKIMQYHLNNKPLKYWYFFGVNFRILVWKIEVKSLYSISNVHVRKNFLTLKWYTKTAKNSKRKQTVKRHFKPYLIPKLNKNVLDN